MFLDTKEDQEAIRLLMIELFKKHYAKAKKFDLWFYHKRDQLWISPEKMKEIIEKGECKRINFDEWQYIAPNLYVKYAQERIEYWLKVKKDAQEELNKTA